MNTRPPRPPKRASPAGKSRRRSAGGLRAQSEVIGTVLIVGMVITSATLIAFSGASVMNQYREIVGQESTTNAIEEIDTELSSVASVGGLTRAEFSVGDARPSQYRIVSSGRINVTANRNATCRASIPLSSLRYERDDGVVIGYEGGAIWRQEDGIVSRTSMHAPPDLTFEDGTLSMTVINVTGEIDGSKNVVYENISRSITENRDIEDALFTGECARPDNVTVSVTSDFYRGWGGYMQSSMDGSDYDTFDSNDTARVFFDQNKLPELLNDSRNTVVDLNSSEFNDVDVTNTSIKVNKSANNTYTVLVTPLTTGSTQVGEIRTVDSDSVYRAPMDVVFVMDESGSMADPDSDGDIKMDKAKAASKAFVGQLNSSKDRAGVVGFGRDGDIKVTANGEYLTDDFGASGTNGSIDNLAGTDWTDIGEGLHDGNAMFGLVSNSSRNKVVILLSDGDNQDPTDPVCSDQTCLNEKAFDEAKIADKNGITIHAVGIGDADDQNMTTIAETTGGTYRYVDDSTDLSEVFLDLFAEIFQSKQIVLDPMSIQLEAGGTTYYPQIDGNTSHIANTSSGELNINDPTAPTDYSFSIDVTDGENVSMRAKHYDCKGWEATGEVHVNQTTGLEYAEVRCTELNESSVDLVPPSKTRVYLDGQNVSVLLNHSPNWWNEDLKNETLAPYLGGPNNETLQLKSNVAIVVFEFDDGDGGTDRLIARYRIGRSTEDTVPKHVFNLEVRHLVIGDDV